MVDRKTRYCLYNCNYHAVWIPKHNRHILIGKIKNTLEQLLGSIATSMEIKILGMEVMPDHVHLFFSAPPRISPSSAVNAFKGVSARMLRMRYPEIKKTMNKGLWTRTYYIGTAGDVSAKAILRYIEEQETHA